MTLKSTGAGEQAFRLWDDRSRTASHSYKARDQRYQWERIVEYRQNGHEITIASLFWTLDRARGWLAAGRNVERCDCRGRSLANSGRALQAGEAAQSEPGRRVPPTIPRVARVLRTLGRVAAGSG